ncbi:MAG: dTMP kinase, partial [Acidobacteria bacterium]|nr:dTMP kinase [Acidobacteriota bacterium]
RAYQGAGRGLGVETVDLLHSGFGVPKPARTYLFDCPVDAAFERLTKRGERDRFEREGRAFHQRVRAAYRAFAKAEPERFCVLPAGKSEDAVFALLSKDLEGFLP